MATKPISTPLPADLPVNWTNSQTVAASGSDVGLTLQHGYNYLMQQVNAAQAAANAINNAFEDLASTEDLDNQTSADVAYTNNQQTTVAGALDTLFQKIKDGTITPVEVTATATGWAGTPATQSLNVPGMTGESLYWVGLNSTATASQRDAARKAVISPTAQGTNSLTLTVDGVTPTVDLPILVFLSGGAA